MNYAITGHTQGIGQAVFNQLTNVKGFSRSNGFDINDYKSRKKIVEQISECDVFINNAQSNFAQTLMLLDVFHSWMNTSKTIINVGSVIAEDETLLKNYEHLLEYQIQKKSLRTLHFDLVNLQTSLNLKYVYFGYVGTERILKKYPHFTPSDYITVDEAVNKILSYN
jgi:hypothetical protein